MKKYNILVIILILAAAGLFFVSRFSQKENDYYGGEWRTYYNDKHGFSIEYPPPYKVFEDATKDIVSFGDPPDPLAVGVFVTSSPYATAEDWLKENPAYRLEKILTVSGYGGIITHYVSNEGDAFDDKLTVFIKDGKLFKILTFYTLHDRILNSFKFE